MYAHPIGNARGRRDFLISQGREFDLITGSTIIIKEFPAWKDKPIRRVYAEKNDLTYTELHFIQAVRRHAQSIDWPYRRSKHDIQFNKMRSLPIGLYDNLIEFDLTAAYWTIAHREGIISQELYDRAMETDDDGELKIRKRVRLMALGSLARVREHHRYPGHGDELIFVGREYDEKTGSMFFEVAHQCSIIMQEVVSATDSVGYWTDAVFMKNTKANEEAAHAIADQYGLSFHPVQFAHCEVRSIRGGRVLYMIEHRGSFDDRTDIRCKWIYVKRDVNRDWVEFMGTMGRVIRDMDYIEPGLSSILNLSKR